MRDRVSSKGGPCELCAARSHPKGFEDAHFYHAGVRGNGKNSGNGCDCDRNKSRVCRRCHDRMHDVGWAELILQEWKKVSESGDLKGMARVGLFKIKHLEARDHYWARRRGETDCSKGTKVGWLARNRRTIC